MGKGYDLIVIGAGPGGYPAALKAAAYGKRVAVVENRELGGTCLNRGCIPTKTFLHASELYREGRAGEAYGIHMEGLHLTYSKLLEKKEEVVGMLRSGIAQQFKKSGIELYQGTGRLLGAGRVCVDGVEVLEAPFCLLATGSKPAHIPVPGAELAGVVDSDGLLSAQQLYRRLTIIGGGVIGMEFATVYSDFGCEVTVLEAMDRLLPGFDKEISQNLRMILKKRGVSIHTGARVNEIRRTEEGLCCSYEEKGDLLEACSDGVLIAAGRKPNTGGLFTPETEAACLENGFIRTDVHGRTGIPGVYAVGDVAGGIQLAHAATAAGEYAVAHMFGMKCPGGRHLIPSCVYTNPEIAAVGMAQEEAKGAGRETVAAKYIMSLNGKTVLSGQERGFIKLLAEKGSGKLLGAQLMCARATDLIGMLELAIAKGMTAAEAAEITLPHPTYGEGMGEALKLLAGEM